MYSGTSPSCRIVTLDAERPRHRLHDVVDADRRARREVDRRRCACGVEQRQEPVDRIVHVHEVDQVLAVAADDEVALPCGHRAQPAAS